jgi:hypothetical protein
MPIGRPNLSERVTCIGRTGTGKTVGGLWHLANYPLDKFPFVLIDFKNEEHFDSLPNVQEVGFDFVPGRKDDGLFRLRCTPYDVMGTIKEKSRLDGFLVHIWEHEDCGLFVDEAYIIGNSTALNLCYTQGRSKQIPMITCTQRPSNCSRYAFSEASFIQCFDLNDQRDIDTVEEFMPIDWDDEPPLLKHQSYYYEIAENDMVRLNPVPPVKDLREIFDAKLRGKRVRL